MKKIVIKKIHACNNINFSSNVNEVIKVVLNSLSFFTKKFHAHKHKEAPKQKQQKHKYAIKQKHKTQISE